jgi:hypothetical protein
MDCWRDIRTAAAYGVDEVSAQEYEQHRGENIRQLVERLKGVLFARLNAKLRGYYNDYGVHGNCASLKQCFFSAMGILQQWLNRRSQRRSYTWAGDTELLARFKVERPRIVGRPKTRLAASRV